MKTPIDPKGLDAAVKAYADVGGRKGVRAAITAYLAICPVLPEGYVAVPAAEIYRCCDTCNDRLWALIEGRTDTESEGE